MNNGCDAQTVSMRGHSYFFSREHGVETPDFIQPDLGNAASSNIIMTWKVVDLPYGAGA